MPESWHPRKTEKDVAVARAGVAKYDRGWKYGGSSYVQEHDHSKLAEGGEVLKPEQLLNTYLVKSESELDTAISNGAALIITKGDFSITSDKALKDNQTLIFDSEVTCDGAKITNADTTGGNSNITIRGRGGGWHLKGAPGNAPTHLVKLVNCTDSEASGIHGKDCNTGIQFTGGARNKANDNIIYNIGVSLSAEDGVRIDSDDSEAKGNICRKSTFRGILMGGSTSQRSGQKVKDNVVLDVEDYCLWGSDCVDAEVSGNYLEGDSQGNQVSGGGAGWRRLNLSLVANNTVVNNYYDGISLGHHQSAGDTANDNRIVNNLVKNNNQAGGTVYRGIAIDAGDAASECVRNTIEGNICIDTQGTKTQTFGIQIDIGGTVDNNEVKENYCAFNKHHGISTGAGKSLVVADNYCYRNQRHGIAITTDTARVTNNTCVENSQETANSYDGINITFTRNDVVTGNQCHDFQTTKTQRYGITVDGLNYLTLVGNSCRFNATGGYNLPGPGDSIAAGQPVIDNNLPELNVFREQTTDVNGQIALSFDYIVPQKPSLQITSESGYHIYVVAWSTDANGRYDGCTLQLSDGAGTNQSVSGATHHITVTPQ